MNSLPELVGTRNDTWIRVRVAVTSLVKVDIFSGPTLFTTLQMPPDAAGVVSFNLKSILQAMGVVPDIIDAELPAFNQSILTVCTKNIKTFGVNIHEINRTDGSLIHSVNLSSRCLLAGLNPELAYSTSLLDYLAGYTPIINRFLTNRPVRILTSTTTQQYLYFFSDDRPGVSHDYELKYQVFFTDGSFSVPYYYSGIGLFNNVGVIPAGYNQFHIENVVYPGMEVDYYLVYLFADDVVTLKYRFDIDRRCYQSGREFIFLNSLGGMDTLRVQAVDDISIKRESDTVERYVGIDTKLTDGQYYEFNVQTNREFKATTMLILDEERKWMQEFFASERIFEITNGKFLPVRITSNSMQIQKQLAAYQTVDFTYRYRFDDIGYTQP